VVNAQKLGQGAGIGIASLAGEYGVSQSVVIPVDDFIEKRPVETDSSL